MTPEEIARYDRYWESRGWSLLDDGAIINGRYYTVHAMERMASDTPEVRAILEARAREQALAEGLQPGTREYSDFIKNYSQPRNIPPMVIEDAITNGVKSVENSPGTWKYETRDIIVVVNVNGDVITVIPK